ncbi:MAG: Cyclopropane-fatty-acyl-phospholipid synthase [Candidatus Kaiserbacteria bacterium]|nr:Cyclopropane-fatty-acyl-phospholipid synthase [Candidatus Kaiserbacteria bacterium]
MLRVWGEFGTLLLGTIYNARMSREKDAVTKFFKDADIEVNGTRPWDIVVHDDRLYKRLLRAGSVGLGEAYMEKWWDSERVDLLFEKLLRVQKKRVLTLQLILLSIKARIFNRQTRFQARQVVDIHYDLSNELYMSFLDPYNQYTCGYFENTDDLNEAQIQKLDLICRKLQLKSTDTVLDIGCGWGGFAKYAAEHYGCKVVGITISDEQLAYATKYVAGFPVEIRKQDYRDLAGEQFDKIVIVGMIEHVGYKNYRKIMEIVSSCLKDDGLFLLHTIGGNETYFAAEPWLDKYIFPNGMVPSIQQLGKSFEKLFVMEDWHNFGPYYYKTLMAWDKNFQKNWPSLKDKFSETFFRMFRYYFNSCAGMFKSRRTELWQIVLSKGADDTIYKSVR